MTHAYAAAAAADADGTSVNESTREHENSVQKRIVDKQSIHIVCVELCRAASVCTVTQRLQELFTNATSPTRRTSVTRDFQLEMTMGMGFPLGMGIPWDSHGNGNW